MTTFFTSDHHFDHDKVIQLSGRPFSSVEEMNEVMIKNHNKKVRPQDTVYILGDFSFKTTAERTSYFLKRLNGKKILIIGNHDFRKDVTGWHEQVDSLIIKINGTKIHMYHFPLFEWDGYWRGSWHLHGHTHGNIKDNPNKLMLDVGVDIHNYEPLSYEEVFEKMSKKSVILKHQ